MKKVIIVGAGPAGLMAAEVAHAAGLEVHVYDAMPSVGRKFLMAGRGGLNLTHSDSPDLFAARYGERRAQIEDLLKDFGAPDVRTWAQGLGVDTFVGSSGRVFPKEMKAAPLLRAWLRRLQAPLASPAPGGGFTPGVQFHLRHRWLGWEGTAWVFEHSQDGINTPVQVEADAVVLALGGGSWARLGSNGAWVPLLQSRGVAVAPLLPANCGFDVQGGWSAHFASRFAGQALKNVCLSCTTSQGVSFERKGEFVATATGVEGSLIYAASSLLRDDLIRTGQAGFCLDLMPHLSAAQVLAHVSHPRGSKSLSSHLKSRLSLEGIKAGLLYELLDATTMNDPARLAASIKRLPILLQAARPLNEAISTAGGVLFEVLNRQLMLESLPGVFCAGEMLDWEAPTGGYLLTASLASGVRAGQGVYKYLT